MNENVPEKCGQESVRIFNTQATNNLIELAALAKGPERSKRRYCHSTEKEPFHRPKAAKSAAN
jgi:hypothetical protein